jgi:hypothetical protein
MFLWFYGCRDMQTALCRSHGQPLIWETAAAYCCIILIIIIIIIIVC